MDVDDEARARLDRLAAGVVLAILVLLTIVYVFGLVAAITRGNEPTAGLHLIVPIIGGAMTVLLRRLWR